MDPRQQPSSSSSAGPAEASTLHGPAVAPLHFAGGAGTAPLAPAVSSQFPAGQVSVALVCHSNVNRSMEAHHALAKAGFALLTSYGTGAKVRLPGESESRANEYAFGTPYAAIAADLRRKNAALYTKTNMLAMIDRDAAVKAAPERFQEARAARWDLVLTFEARVYDAVLEDLRRRAQHAQAPAPCHVVNIETPDTHEEARAAAAIAVRFVHAVHAAVPLTAAAAAGEQQQAGSSSSAGEVSAAAALSRFQAHLGLPAALPGHADASLWEDRLPALVRALEAETRKPVHHALVWV